MARRILITQRVVENDSYAERRDALSQDWSRYLQHLYPDAAIIPVPNALDHPADWIETVQGDVLVLSNGNDWGDAPERDRTEIALIASFKSNGRPVLGVCRGIQALNAAAGGGIMTDVAAVSGKSHVARDHSVTLCDERFAELAGGKTLTVNSFHGQGVAGNSLAPGFRAFALAEGDIVEGMLHETHAMLGIQWHPERVSPSAAFDEKLIRALFDTGAFWLRGNTE